MFPPLPVLKILELSISGTKTERCLRRRSGVDFKAIIQFRFTLLVNQLPQSLPTRSHHGTTQNRALEMHYHTSSPPSHLTHHNQHEVDQQAITPVAGQYMSSVHRYPQVPAAIPIVPSRSWSPIPSVHRESIRDDSELDRSDLDGSEGRSWVNHVHHAVPELDFYNDAGEVSTLRKEPNAIPQERTYIDYSMGRISKPESQVCHPSLFSELLGTETLR